MLEIAQRNAQKHKLQAHKIADGRKSIRIASRSLIEGKAAVLWHLM